MNQLDKFKILTIPIGAILSIICFFLPWLKLSIGGAELNMSGIFLGDELWIVFAAAIVILAAYFYFISSKQSQNAKIAILISSNIAIAIMIIRYIMFQQGWKTDFGTIRPEDYGLTIQFGAILAAIGFFISELGINYLDPPAKPTPDELRYNYLGFDVAPRELKEFWTSEAEKNKYVEKIRKQSGKPHNIERESSIVNSSLLSKTDITIISIASALMIISLFLPYYRFDAFGKNFSGLAINYIFHLGNIGSFVAWGDLILKIIFTLSIILILLSPLIGLINLVSLNTGRKTTNYFDRLKSLGKLNILAIILYLLLIVLIFVEQPGILALASFSIWLNIAAHLLGIIPAMEL